ncbi:MAG: response regulator [Lachnospiraceae bacterium]|nr:response regulator [Lachnospiraceae bacterium]
MTELSVLLVEDDTMTCKNFYEYIDTKEDIFLVNYTNSAKQAIEYIDYYHPDAIILDLELHMGNGTGIDVLTALQNYDYHPYILVTTNNISKITYEQVRQLGADFIMYKHQEDYSEKSVIEFLLSLKNIIKDNSSKIINTLESPEYTEKRLNTKINRELDTVGISPKALGYQYLTSAIKKIINGQTDNLLKSIATEYQKSESSVERAMQNAINKAWTTSDLETLTKVYTGRISSSKGSPTVTEFIFYYSNKIKAQL